MAYGESNGHVLDDVACPGLLIRNWLHNVTPRPEKIKLLGNNYRKTANTKQNAAVYHCSQRSCIVSHIENSKNDKGYVTKQHVDII